MYGIFFLNSKSAQLPQFSIWIPTALAKIYFSSLVKIINCSRFLFISEYRQVLPFLNTQLLPVSNVLKTSIQALEALLLGVIFVMRTSHFFRH